MGTHPIFESDFDCLTEQSEKMPGQGRPKKPEEEKAPKPVVGGKWKEGGRGRPPGKVGKKQLHAFISFKKQNTQAALDFKKKTGDETHYTKLLGNWWKELDDKTKESFKDADFKYVIKK